ncbi:unnamed protein product [Rotaria sordida]|uniref:Uncharacterized protein n=2 Tax=Rotaria sordida TaxID=392033 RepID=A0A813RCM9_9BILA|nr:unnamed protein product [Rotaria sordida]
MIDINRHRGTSNKLDSNDADLTSDVRLTRNKRISTSTGANRKSLIATYTDLQVLHESEEDQLDNNEDNRSEMNLNEVSTDNQDISTSDDHGNKLNSLKNLSYQSLTTKSSTDMTRGVRGRRSTLSAIEQHDLRTYVRRRRDSIVQHIIGYNYDDNSTVGGLYTRIGIGIFCLGTVIHSALSILSNLENRLCIRWISLMDNSSRLLFSFIQFFFIFKHSNLIIRAHQSLAQLAVMHIVVTNLCVW